MRFSPYDDEQLRAAQALLQIFAPPYRDEERLEAKWQDALDDCDDEEAPIYATLATALGETGSFRAPSEDIAALITAVGRLGESWEATVLFGARDAESLYTHHQDSVALLTAAAVELRAYGLCLWCWEAGEEEVAGFICREADADLVEKWARSCGAALYAVGEEWE